MSRVETEISAEISLNVPPIGIGASIRRKYTTESEGFLSFPAWIGRFRVNPADQQIMDDVARRARDYGQTVDVSQYRIDSYWLNVSEQPKITAIVSGKGGVGKSSLALGLAEFYSITENVLVVDFDLHNRGLTSKYGQLSKSSTTILAEMRRFSSAVLSDEKLPREGGKVHLGKIEEELFFELRDKFCYAKYPAKARISPLNMEYLYAEDVRREPPLGRARPSNCYFLPSRRAGEPFLGSSESRFDVAEVTLFLRFLGCLAHKNGITQIILDCHGAHDLFMVGAILASDHLVLVTRPEPAAFEGTIELMRFAQSVVESRDVYPSSHSLVFNEYRSSDRAIAETLFNLVYLNDENNDQRSFEKVPKISSSNELRDLFKFYDRPSILDHAKIGRQISEIGRKSA
ncbi:MAG: ParA family protein [Gammaproteobacteria bacterium]|nr:ParA family protein [Gammaproteobacteria bacterium]